MSKQKSQQSTSPFLIVITIFFICIATYLVTPRLYQEIKNKEYSASFETFKDDLSQSRSIEDMAITYAIENDAIVSIQNETTGVAYQTPTIDVVQSMHKKANITTSNNQSLIVEVQYTYQTLSDMTSVLLIILPLVGVIFALIFLLYLTLGKVSSKENYQDFVKATDDMLRLKPKVSLSTKSKNRAKNLVAQNINDLYLLLLDKNEQLNQRNKDYQLLLDQTNQTIQNMKGTLKANVNDILKDVTGMIQNQGPYKNHQIYLLETKMKLEALLNQPQTHHELPSTIHEIFEKILQPYELLAGQKQVNISYDFKKNFKVIINGMLFHQAVGHLMTFVLNQCKAQSQINIIQQDYDIIIAYKGACLTEESIQQVEKLDENVKALYRIIKQLGFFVDYMQTEQKDGMQFVFHF